MAFVDRSDAGQQLAQRLKKLDLGSAVVFGLPRGGVIVAVEVARELSVPLDVLFVRKVGHPTSPEYAIGAVTDDGCILCNPRELEKVNRKWFDMEVLLQREEARRQHEVYLPELTPLPIRDQTVIVVDDGLATGLTMRAALASVRARKPAKTVVAVPVAPSDALEELRLEAHEVVSVLATDDTRTAVGAYYDDFSQASDQDVLAAIRSLRTG